MTPYEMRLETLKLSQQQLHNEYEVLVKNSPSEEIPYPTHTEILKVAKELNELIGNG